MTDSDERKYWRVRLRPLRLSVVAGDGCVEVVHHKFRVLFFWPPAIFICGKGFIFDWNVYRDWHFTFEKLDVDKMKGGKR